ncbi:MAG: hypothetical protein LUF92_06070 [Clostridiales bacterium]|nr:hypothetical protein [Clostridiales bacterium]
MLSDWIPEGDQTAWTYVCAFLILFTLTAIFTFLYRYRGIFLIMTALLPVFYLLRTGWKPGMISVMLLLACCMFRLMPSLRSSVPAVAVLLVLCGIFLWSDAGEGNGEDSRALSYVAQMWERWKYNDSTDVLPEGQLNLAGSSNRGEETVLTIKMDILSPYYLRGFTGTVFEGNAWTNNQETIDALNYGAGDEASFAEMQWDVLWFRALSRSSLHRLAEEDIEADDFVENNLSITNQNASRRYLYLPYESTTLISDYKNVGTAVSGTAENIYATGLRGQSNYSCNAFTCLAEVMDELVDQTASVKSENAATTEDVEDEETAQISQEDGDTAEGGTDEESTAKESMAEELMTEKLQAYKEYVDSTCLTLTKEEKEIISSIFNEGKTGATISAVSLAGKIRQWLDENITYDTEPGNIPEGESFAQWFFQDHMRGYDVHYATAAVMLFRYYGIPARYVEGYLVTPDALRDAADSGEVEVTEQEAHAWVEVYLEEVGWIPVEVMEDYEERMGVSYLEGWSTTIISTAQQDISEDSSVDSRQQENAAEEAGESDTTDTARETTSEGSSAGGESQETASGESKKDGESQDSASEEPGAGGESQNAGSAEADSSLRSFMLWAIVILLAAGTLYVIVCRQRNRRFERSWDDTSDYGYSVRMYYFKLCRLLYVADKKKKGTFHQALQNDCRIETIRRMLEIYDPVVDTVRMDKAFAIRQKAVYSEELLTEEEREAACSFLKQEISVLTGTFTVNQRLRILLENEKKKLFSLQGDSCING